MTTADARVMSAFWRRWLVIWCVLLGGSGVVLAAGAFEATSAPTRLFFELVNGPAAFSLDDQTRFVLGVMGGVSVGLAFMTYAAVEAAAALGAAGGRIWRLASLGIVGWCLVDSTVSALVGYGANVAPNLLILAGFLAPILASGVLRAEPRPLAA